MIHFVTGKPGGGKSMYAMQCIVRELVTSNRDVVTNLPVRRDILNAFLQRRYPQIHVPLLGPENRLTLLDEGGEVRAIYKRYKKEWDQAKKSRASDEVLEAIYQAMEKEIGSLEVPVQTAKFWEYRNPRKKRFDDAVGTLFVLDEVHLYFNARKWQETGEEAIRYLSQHRHFSDDVLLVTQHADNVDMQFRRLVEDWAVIKNGYTQKIGWFRALPRFTRSVYTSQPTGGARQVPFERTTFSLDAKGLASCYNTAAAAGVHANGADTGRKPRGLHPAWFVVFLLSGALVLGGLIKGANGYAASKVMGSAEAAIAAHQVPPVSPSLSPSVSPAVGVHAVAATPNDRRKVRGYAVRGERVRVLMETGETLTEDLDDGLEGIRRNKVWIRGEAHYLIPAQDRPPSPALPASSAPAVLDAAETPALPPPPAANTADRWATHSDGVSRLKRTETLAEALAR